MRPISDINVGDIYERGYPFQLEYVVCNIDREPLKRMGDFAVYADDEVPVVDAMTGELLRWRWKVNTLSQIFMPYEATRTICRIVGHRPERLQDITEEDARAEGIIDGGCLNCGEHEPCGCQNPRPDARDAFIHLWKSIHGEGSWEKNQWLWAITLERVR